jgi:hypothetical protein
MDTRAQATGRIFGSAGGPIPGTKAQPVEDGPGRSPCRCAAGAAPPSQSGNDNAAWRAQRTKPMPLSSTGETANCELYNKNDYFCMTSGGHRIRCGVTDLALKVLEPKLHLTTSRGRLDAFDAHRTFIERSKCDAFDAARARACGFRRNHCGSPSSLEAVSAFGGGRKDVEITTRRYPTCTLADRPKGHRDHRGHQLSSGRPMLPMTPDRRSQVGGLEFHADESASAGALPRARRRKRRTCSQRRGRKLPSNEDVSKRRLRETDVPLTVGRLNTIRAAFKAGITPSRIARQFRVSQSAVRKALAGDKP